jgi:acyl carrier protein
MQTTDIERDVRAFLAEKFFYGLTEKVSVDAPLGNVLDSWGVLELVTYLQEHFKITVADDDVIPENLGSVQQVVAYVDGKLKAQSTNA